MDFLLALIVMWMFLIGLGMYVGDQKGRGAAEGFILTLLFGPFGILIEALLPTKTPPVATQHHTSSAIDDFDRDEAIRRYAEKQKREAEADRQAFLDEIQRKKQAAAKKRAARHDAYQAMGITPGPFAWYEALSMHFIKWYKNASDLMQLLVISVGVSIPAALVAILIFKFAIAADLPASAVNAVPPPLPIASSVAHPAPPVTDPVLTNSEPPVVDPVLIASEPFAPPLEPPVAPSMPSPQPAVPDRP